MEEGGFVWPFYDGLDEVLRQKVDRRERKALGYRLHCFVLVSAWD